MLCIGRCPHPPLPPCLCPSCFTPGDGTYGQLGNGVTKEACTCGRRKLQSIQCGCIWNAYNVTAPVAVVGGIQFSVLDASPVHVCAIAANGTAYCWWVAPAPHPAG